MTVPTPITADLPAIASRLLALAAAGVDNCPTRQLRAAGVPVWDFGASGQLAVFIASGAPGIAGALTTGRPEQRPSFLRSYTVTIELARCVKTPNDDGTAPSAAALDTDGAMHIADYRALDEWVQSLGFSSKVNDEALRDAGVKEIAAAAMSTVGPQGGYAAVRASVVVTV